MGCFTWNTQLSSVGSILGFLVPGVVLENCGLSFCALTLAQLVSSVENCLGEESLSSCNSSLPMPLPAWDQQMESTFIRKIKKIGLQVESVSFTFCCFPLPPKSPNLFPLQLSHGGRFTSDSQIAPWEQFTLFLNLFPLNLCPSFSVTFQEDLL